ncbi:MAG: alpha-galactosidase [Pirellulaceae bacterium]
MPFSFLYGGTPSANLITDWEQKVATQDLDGQRAAQTTWLKDPKTGLSVRCVLTVYRDFPAVEWVLYFKNEGTTDTFLLENIQALDAVFPSAASGDVTLYHNAGTDAKITDYEPLQTTIGINAERRFMPYGGRPSDRVLPFFNMQQPDGTGLVLGIGWTGRWAATFSRSTDRAIRATAGMEVTRLTLHPGEEIRTPAILVLFWLGEDHMRGHNLLRRLLLTHYSPTPGGREVRPPTAASVHANISFEATSEANLLDSIRNIAAHRSELDVLWVDAGWFACPSKPNGWAETTGNLDPDPVRFPRGLRPVADAAHANGLKFLLWFEPERAMPGSWLYQNHPQWLLTPANLPPERAYETDWKMLNFGDSEALAWAKSHYSRFIKENGIDIYRQDCNLHPLYYWRNGESPDRQGIREIKHVMGMYDYLDTLVRENPGLMLDVCAGTGSRNDFEIMRRALNLTRSDGAWWNPIGDQSKTYGYSFWSPITGIGAVSPTVYDFRSGLGAHITACFDFAHESPETWEKWTSLIGEQKSVQQYFTGDFYPLTGYSVAPDVWMAWQFHRPDLGEGMVMAFRRPDSLTERAAYRLQGLKAEANYSVVDRDDPEPQTIAGQDLIEHGLAIRLLSKPASSLIVYREIASANGVR